nr:MAG TPA: hypothetical protein [Caudoviricetes sp.]
MKKDYIAEVEVVDVGEKTLFNRCPAEFSGRIFEEDDRLSRYGFIEKITVYEEDGSESTYLNQVKLYPRNYTGDPRDDFVVIVMGSDVWNKELKCRYNDIIARLEEKGLKFKLELFLADLLKVDTGCYSADSEVDPTKDTKGTFDFFNQIYILPKNEGCFEVAIPMNKVKDVIIGDGVVIYDKRDPSSVSYKEGLIQTHDDCVDVCRDARGGDDTTVFHVMGYLSHISDVARKNNHKNINTMLFKALNVDGKDIYYGIVSLSNSEGVLNRTPVIVDIHLSIYNKVADYLSSKPSGQQFMPVFELNRCGYTNFITVFQAVDAIKAVNSFSDFGFSGEELRVTTIMGITFISLGTIPSIDSIIEQYGKSSIWQYSRQYAGMARSRKLSDEQSNSIAKEYNLYAIEMTVCGQHTPLGTVVLDEGKMSRSLVVSLVRDDEDTSVVKNVPSFMQTYFNHQGRDIMLSKAVSFANVWFGKPQEGFKYTKVVKNIEWIKEHYDVYYHNGFMFLVSKEGITNEKEALAELVKE